MRQRNNRGTTQPTHSLVFSARIGENKYKQGPSLGLWTVENSKVLFRGGAKEDRLDELAGFLKKVADKGYYLSISLFKNTPRDEEIEPEPEPEPEANPRDEEMNPGNAPKDDWDL